MDEVKALIEAALFSAGRMLRVEDLARVCVSGNLGQIRRSAGAQVIHAVDRPDLAVEPDAEIALRQAGQGAAVAVAHLDVEERQRDFGRLGEQGQGGEPGGGCTGLPLASGA